MIYETEERIIIVSFDKIADVKSGLVRVIISSYEQSGLLIYELQLKTYRKKLRYLKSILLIEQSLEQIITKKSCQIHLITSELLKIMPKLNRTETDSFYPYHLKPSKTEDTKKTFIP